MAQPRQVWIRQQECSSVREIRSGRCPTSRDRACVAFGVELGSGADVKRVAVTLGMTKPASSQELFRGRHFDREIILLCVRWYLTFKFELPRPGPDEGRARHPAGSDD